MTSVSQQPLFRSVATKAALALSALIGPLFVLAGFLSFNDAREQSLADSLQRLDGYNREVVGQQEDRFRRLAASHRQATELLMGELRGGGSDDRDRDFDALFPRKADGTRRTASGLFDGAQTSFGYVRGIGGFIGREPDEMRKLLLTAALRVLHTIGEGSRPDLKSMSFFTPDNTLMMFAPDRPDKLLFYREGAGPDLDFSSREFVSVTRPENNPTRTTRCTTLQPILYDKTKQTWTTGCHTPIDINGVHVGAWGNSLLLDDILATSRFELFPGTEVILVSAEGRLIRHPVYTRQQTSATERYLDLTKANEPGLRALWQVLRRVKGLHWTGYSPQLGGYVSIRRIPTANWFAVTVQDVETVEAPARRTLQRVVLTGLICLSAQATILFFFLRHRVGVPLRELMSETGALTARVSAGKHWDTERGHDEVAELASHFRIMSAEIMRAQITLENRVVERTRQLEEANGELRHLAERDPLTGLYNRRKILELLERAVSEADLTESFSVIIFDVDHFKKINDTYGHVIGDRVLKLIGHTTPSALRPGDTMARIGGEEFLILLPNADAFGAYEVAERVRASLANLVIETDEVDDFCFTVSVGLTDFETGDTSETLYQRADDALYEAKRSGRNRTTAQPSLRASSARQVPKTARSS